MAAKQKVTQEIANILGVKSFDSSDDIWASGFWLRVQPAGCGLEHRSETSNGELSNGVHVHCTLAQAIDQEGRWEFEGEGCELVVIRGPENLADTEDVEGWVLPIGKGEIVGRFGYDAVCGEW